MRVADYVVVGAGTAGCVVAARLAEAGARVVLLEAGGTDRRPDVMIPGAASRLHRSSADWGFYTVAQTTLASRRVYVPRGKVIGGSGSTNTMIAIRGVPLDYDEWAEDGANGWSWRHVQPVFDAIDRRMRPERPTYTHPLWRAFIEAASQRGIVANDEGFQGDNLDGAGLFHVHVRGGRRLSTARAYLRSARPKPAILTGVHARELIFEERRCVGVRFRRGGRIETARATREVILCAGAIGSPHLLLLSGIGPRDHLNAMGIKVRTELPVGAGMQDHPIVHLADGSRIPTANSTIERPVEALRYLATREGMLAWPLPGAGGFVRTKPGPRPDVQLHFVAGWAHDPHDFAGRPAADGYILAPTVCKPKSRGRIRLASPFPEEPPAIDPALLSHPEDLATMVRGVKLAQTILDAPAFDRVRGVPLRPSQRLHDDAAIEEFIRAACGTTYHPSCTCSIGSVVDAELRVLGLGGLRVVDASVMPSVTTANTNLPTIMIAERAAQLLGRG